MINKTKNYSIFKRHESNRSLDEKNLERIKSSISSRNLLEFRPIIVDRNMCVIDGQHRLEAAKQLDVDVWYQVDQEARHEDILLLNLNQKVWTIENYLTYYISIGNVNYKKFNEFIKKYSLDVRKGIRLLLSSSSSANKSFRNGSFVFPSEERIAASLVTLEKYNASLELIRTNKNNGRLLCASAKLCSTLLDFLNNKYVDFETFKNKLLLNIARVRPCVSIGDCYVMFKEIYNWKNREPIE